MGLKVLYLYAFIGLKVLCHLHFKDFNVFNHLCFQRLQCLRLHFKYFNVFCLLHLQDFNVFYFLHFIRLQDLLSFIGLNVLVFVLLRTQRPLFLRFGKKKNFKCLLLYRTSMSSLFTFYRTSMSFCL